MTTPEFVKEHNAKHMIHPMAHQAPLQDKTPPKIISSGEGVYVTDVDGNRMVDGVGGLWNVNHFNLWNPRSDEQAQWKEEFELVVNMAFSPSGKRLSISGKVKDLNNLQKVWDISSNEPQKNHHVLRRA